MVSSQVKQEQLLRKLWLKSIPVLKGREKVIVRVYHPVEATVKDTKFEEVYGVQDTVREDFDSYTDIEVLISDDPWTPSGFFTASVLEEGYIYTEDELIDVGTIFQIVREVDGQEELSRKYKVQEPETVGITMIVMRKFKIKPLGE
jgi:hypothetical protein